MNADKKKIVEFAKELYLTYGADGKRLYAFRDISTKILKKFDKKLHFSTIGNWAVKYDWVKLNDRIKQQSIEKAKNDNFSKEEQLVEQESTKLAKDYKNAENLANVGFGVVFEAYKGNKSKNNLINVRDGLSAIRLGMDIKFRINDIPELDKDKNSTIIILPSNDREK